MRAVVIIGGGISGLSTAYYLKQNQIPSVLVERRPELGGVIATEMVDDCLVEAGPDSFLAAKPWAMELIREVGLEDEVIGSNDHLRVTYVRRKGRLVPLPDGLMMMVPTKIGPMVTTPLLSWATKLRMGSELLRQANDKDTPDRTVAEFVADHYGSEAVDYLAEPLLAGVYGGSPDQLSVGSVLPRFVELESRYGSLTRGVLAAMAKARGRGESGPLFRTLKGGLGSLTDTLRQRIAETTQVVQGEAETVERTPDGLRVSVNGDWIETDAVVLACPAYEAARVCRGIAAEASDLLEEIPYSSSMTVALGYDRSGFRQQLNGFGFLIPKKERKRLIACTWVGTKFDHRVSESRILLRSFLGGADDPEILDEPDDTVAAIVREELREIMGVTEMPLFSRVSRWPRSMAQYTVGHEARVREIEKRIATVPGLHLAGNAYHGIGIPDCVRMGRDAATAIAGGSGAAKSAVNP